MNHGSTRTAALPPQSPPPASAKPFSAPPTGELPAGGLGVTGLPPHSRHHGGGREVCAVPAVASAPAFQYHHHTADANLRRPVSASPVVPRVQRGQAQQQQQQGSQPSAPVPAEPSALEGSLFAAVGVESWGRSATPASQQKHFTLSEWMVARDAGDLPATPGGLLGSAASSVSSEGGGGSAGVDGGGGVEGASGVACPRERPKEEGGEGWLCDDSPSTESEMVAAGAE